MFGNGFAAAQRAHDNAEPPDWDGEGTEVKECREEVAFPADAPDDAEQPVCDFTGKVDVYYAGNTATWTCPKCKAEHEDDDTPEPWEE